MYNIYIDNILREREVSNAVWFTVDGICWEHLKFNLIYVTSHIYPSLQSPGPPEVSYASLWQRHWWRHWGEFDLASAFQSHSPLDPLEILLSRLKLDVSRRHLRKDRVHIPPNGDFFWACSCLALFWRYQFDTTSCQNIYIYICKKQ